MTREAWHLPLPNQELISGHFGEDSASYEAEIRELEDLRQVGGFCPSPLPSPFPAPSRRQWLVSQVMLRGRGFSQEQRRGA